MRARGKIAAISPIVGNAPVAGPAGILMQAQGWPCSIAGVARAYEEFLDILICDSRDARAAESVRQSGLRVHCTQTIMRTADDKAALAREVLSLAVPNIVNTERGKDEVAGTPFQRLDRES
jgi:LPPG:FO 2-phospho-L-lactate transferase